MYLDNLKRKPTVIIIMFALIGAIFAYLAFIRRSLFWLIIFTYMLLCSTIQVSRYATQKMMELVRRKYFMVDQGLSYKPMVGRILMLVFSISSPFYLFWFLVSFIATLNVYFFIVLYFPILTLSFLTFWFVYRAWNTLEGGAWLFWGFHVVMFFFVQLLGWCVRISFLKEFFG